MRFNRCVDQFFSPSHNITPHARRFINPTTNSEAYEPAAPAAASVYSVEICVTPRNLPKPSKIMSQSVSSTHTHAPSAIFITSTCFRFNNSHLMRRQSDNIISFDADLFEHIKQLLYASILQWNLFMKINLSRVGTFWVIGCGASVWENINSEWIKMSFYLQELILWCNINVHSTYLSRPDLMNVCVFPLFWQKLLVCRRFIYSKP